MAKIAFKDAELLLGIQTVGNSSYLVNNLIIKVVEDGLEISEYSEVDVLHSNSTHQTRLGIDIIHSGRKFTIKNVEGSMTVFSED